MMLYNVVLAFGCLQKVIYLSRFVYANFKTFLHFHSTPISLVFNHFCSLPSSLSHTATTLCFHTFSSLLLTLLPSPLWTANSEQHTNEQCSNAREHRAQSYYLVNIQILNVCFVLISFQRIYFLQTHTHQNTHSKTFHFTIWMWAISMIFHLLSFQSHLNILPLNFPLFFIGSSIDWNSSTAKWMHVRSVWLSTIIQISLYVFYANVTYQRGCFSYIFLMRN